MKSTAGIIFFLLVCTVSSLIAGEVDVVKVAIQAENSGTYRFDVTLHHEDTGWDHYADSWEILNPEGEVLTTRVLMHPHVNEQPFTRSLSGVPIPKGFHEVTVRGHDSVHGYGGKEIKVMISR